MKKIKLFLASSEELKTDREQFEIFTNRKNKDWVNQGLFLDLIIWEDFLDAMSKTRLQEEYNIAIRDCDIFVMLFFTKVGKYTEEEFETAFGQFKTTNRPFIYTYFKDAQVWIGKLNKQDMMSLFDFQEKLRALGHFITRYKNMEDLKLQFNKQLDTLAEDFFLPALKKERTQWISMPFKPEPLSSPIDGGGEIPPAFRIGATEVLTPDAKAAGKMDRGAAGIMAISVPPNVRQINRLKVTCTENEGQVIVKLFRGVWDEAREQFYRDIIVDEQISSGPFSKKFLIKDSKFSTEYNTLSLLIRGTRRTRISLVSFEFTY